MGIQLPAAMGVRSAPSTVQSPRVQFEQAHWPERWVDPAVSRGHGGRAALKSQPLPGMWVNTRLQSPALTSPGELGDAFRLELFSAKNADLVTLEHFAICLLGLIVHVKKKKNNPKMHFGLTFPNETFRFFNLRGFFIWHFPSILF